MDKSQGIKKLEEKLKSNNPSAIADTINHLRDEKPFRGAVKLIVELLDKTDNHVLVSLIKNFLNDLKDKDCQNEIIAELSGTYSNSTIASIAASCWQSGLDYSGYTPVFASLFLKGDFQIALECFTVLEESAPGTAESTRKEVLQILSKGKMAISTEKDPFLKSLLTLYS
jgi:hypothetical protein